MGFVRRFTPLATGFVSLAVMCLFAFTSLAWKWEGRPDESYPEIIYGSLGLPAALVAVTAGALLARKTVRRGRWNDALHLLWGVLWGVAITFCATLAIYAVWPLVT